MSAQEILNRLLERERAMLRHEDGGIYQPASFFSGAKAGQALAHLFRREPGLFERQWNPSGSLYRMTFLGRAVRDLMLPAADRALTMPESEPVLQRIEVPSYPVGSAG